MMKCPCTRDSAMRSADCRRTCGAFRAYDEQRMQEYIQRKAACDAAEAANPAYSAARQAIRRRIQKRNLRKGRR